MEKFVIRSKFPNPFEGRVMSYKYFNLSKMRELYNKLVFLMAFWDVPGSIYSLNKFYYLSIGDVKLKE